MQIQNVVINAKLIAQKFHVNLNMAKGNIIEADDSAKPVYRSVTSEFFDWAEIIKSQPGIEINNEEYQKILRETKVTVDLKIHKRYIRIVAEDNGVQKQAAS